MASVMKSIRSYDISELPADFMEFLDSFVFQMVLLAIMYYGGMGLLLYYIYKLPLDLRVTVWSMSMIVNIVMILSLPGLFYLDNLSKVSSYFIIIIIGPLNFLRAFVYYLSFKWNVKKRNVMKYNMWRSPPSRTTVFGILRTPVSKWRVDDPWINSVRRNADIGLPTFWDKCRKKLRLIRRIAGYKIF
jgi:hypothetical protein